MSWYWRRLRSAVVDLWRELRTPEAAALLITTLVLITRHALGRTTALDGVWRWLSDHSPLFAERMYQRQVIAIALQLAVPALAAWLLHRVRLREIGLGLGEWKLWVPLTVVIFVIQVVVVAGFLADAPAYARRYPSLGLARGGGPLFWGWEASRVVYMLSWEFLFRGYLLFLLARRIGLLAAVVQMVPFALMHIVSGKPVSEVYFTVGSGVLSAVFAWEARSVWPIVFLHAAGAVLLDFCIVF